MGRGCKARLMSKGKNGTWMVILPEYIMNEEKKKKQEKEMVKMEL